MKYNTQTSHSYNKNNLFKKTYSYDSKNNFQIKHNVKSKLILQSSKFKLNKTNSNYNSFVKVNKFINFKNFDKINSKSKFKKNNINRFKRKLNVLNNQNKNINKVNLENIYKKVYNNSLRCQNIDRKDTLARQLSKKAIKTSINCLRKKYKLKLTSNNKSYCMFYCRFGKCTKLDTCPYKHDFDKVAVCSGFLNGKCKVKGCLLSHKIDPEKMPVCSFFLKGICNIESCPYRHVNVNLNAEICKDFLRGFCSKGIECKLLHKYICSKCKKVSCSKCCPEEKKKLIKKSVSRTADIENVNSNLKVSFIPELEEISSQDGSIDLIEDKNEQSLNKFSVTHSPSTSSLMSIDLLDEMNNIQSNILPEFIPLANCSEDETEDLNDERVETPDLLDSNQIKNDLDKQVIINERPTFDYDSDDSWYEGEYNGNCQDNLLTSNYKYIPNFLLNLK